MHILLQWDESWRVGGTNTGPSVFDGFVRDTEFTQVVSNHFRLDFNLVKSLAIVHSNNAAGHLRNDNHVSQMCFNDVGFLVDWALLLLLRSFLINAMGLRLRPR